MQLYPDRVEATSPARELSKALARYQGGESRKAVFQDLVRSSVQTFPKRAPRFSTSAAVMASTGTETCNAP